MFLVPQRAPATVCSRIVLPYVPGNAMSSTAVSDARWCEIYDVRRARASRSPARPSSPSAQTGAGALAARGCTCTARRAQLRHDVLTCSLSRRCVLCGSRHCQAQRGARRPGPAPAHAQVQCDPARAVHPCVPHRRTEGALAARHTGASARLNSLQGSLTRPTNAGAHRNYGMRTAILVSVLLISCRQTRPTPQ